jgi:predicted XRE-type DNA-binding protein
MATTKDSATPIRTIIVHDILFDGDMRQGGALQDMLEDYADGFLSYVKSKNPEVAAKIVIEQTQSAIPYKSERRGLTGSLEEIVFRGSRGKNFNADRPTIPDEADRVIRQKLFSIRQHLEKKGLGKEEIEETLQVRQKRLHMLAKEEADARQVRAIEGDD